MKFLSGDHLFVLVRIIVMQWLAEAAPSHHELT